MIQRTAAAATADDAVAASGRRVLPAWQRALGDAVGSVGELLGLLGIDAAELPGGGATTVADFPLRVPRGFVARMRRGDPADPLLLQVLPTAAELGEVPGFVRDPVGELGEHSIAVAPVPGVLHKYRGRALLVVTGACGVHCRYCFRRHFPYAEQARWGDGFARALDWLAATPTVEEVILSGGDPLSLPDDRLAELASRLRAIPHLRRLRVHTRMPIVLAERVDDALLAWLAPAEQKDEANGGRRLSPVVVLHANHAQELDADVAAAASRLRGAGVTLLNQAVLLRDVNDSVAALAELSRRLLDVGVVPYYLNQLDRVAGAAHFEVSDARARELQRALMETLPGYLVPRLVREVAGAPFKVPLELAGE